MIMQRSYWNVAYCVVPEQTSSAINSSPTIIDNQPAPSELACHVMEDFKFTSSTPGRRATDPSHHLAIFGAGRTFIRISVYMFL